MYPRISCHRQVIDAIAFRYRTGTPWMDLPEYLGSWKRDRRAFGGRARDGPVDRAVPGGAHLGPSPPARVRAGLRPAPGYTPPAGALAPAARLGRVCCASCPTRTPTARSANRRRDGHPPRWTPAGRPRNSPASSTPTPARVRRGRPASACEDGERSGSGKHGGGGGVSDPHRPLFRSHPPRWLRTAMARSASRPTPSGPMPSTASSRIPRQRSRRWAIAHRVAASAPEVRTRCAASPAGPVRGPSHRASSSSSRRSPGSRRSAQSVG
ncbi:hypothetical protein DEJ46_36975 [Streptomyces venezuelae]|uniref:Insertion element IS402-like domain-containing protein n=1 Tax=Streptomyces venezuelae TaxID=54571 RepID=A0A5P2B2R0_STRVZ|nr:hypothetical protein DEJ46_36975 [Streptomyces venezuelae]